MNPVGRIVKEKRERAGLSQNSLAKKAGISQASLHALENKTSNPSVETIFMLAAALDCTVSELLGEKTSGAVLTESQRRILRVYDQLNETGRMAVIGLAETLLQDPKYRQDVSISSAI